MCVRVHMCVCVLVGVVVVLVVVVVRGVHGCVGVGVRACMCGSLYCINEIVTL